MLACPDLVDGIIVQNRAAGTAIRLQQVFGHNCHSPAEAIGSAERRFIVRFLTCEESRTPADTLGPELEIFCQRNNPCAPSVAQRVGVDSSGPPFNLFLRRQHLDRTLIKLISHSKLMFFARHKHLLGYWNRRLRFKWEVGNSARSAVTVLSCGMSLVAHLPRL